MITTILLNTLLLFIVVVLMLVSFVSFYVLFKVTFKTSKTKDDNVEPTKLEHQDSTVFLENISSAELYEIHFALFIFKKILKDNPHLVTTFFTPQSIEHICTIT